ncbi:M12 family metallopeptidase [Sphingobacterium sp.]|uniref:M12 family metallopeptidase n=1 Tax=Sphingobacterium sp. TaxID=341027 RepID=UPI0028AE440A|nr:M12 family metallopeptidase [Sphingobacterium sp.]
MKLSLLKLTVLLLVMLSCSKQVDNSEGGKNGNKFDQEYVLNIDGNRIVIKESNGKYYFSEDEILSERQFNILKSLQNNSTTKARSVYTSEFIKYWPNNIIYYKNSSTKANVSNALNHIANRTGVAFVERTNQTNYIEFVNANENSSDVGMQGGKQIVNIYNDITGIIVHEVLHAMGFFHEMVRSDRDNFINIFYSNIENGQSHNFNVRPEAVSGGDFDFGSIMMYSSYAFSKNNQPTILKKNGTEITEYQRAEMSALDAFYVREKYPVRIVGPDYFCPSGTYSLEGLKSDAVVTWAFSGNSALYSGSSGVFNRNPNSLGGEGSIVATITRNGVSFEVNKNVYVGLSPSGINYYSSSALVNKSVMLKYGTDITWNPSTSYYEVRSLDGILISPMPNGFNPSQNNSLFVSGVNGFRLADPYSGISSINVEIRYYTSACGWTNWQRMNVVF